MTEDTPIKGETKTYSHEAYVRMRAAGDTHESASYKWAISEIDRLRKSEAHEAKLSSLIAAWVEFDFGSATASQKIGMQQLDQQGKALMCRAIYCLCKRDNIRKLEGALSELQLLEADARREARAERLVPNLWTASRLTGFADELNVRTIKLQSDLDSARASR